MEKDLKQRSSDCIKVVLYGPESSGKTTLAETLAKYYHTEWVPEYAREYLQKKFDDAGEICAIEDLIPIARGQMRDENRLTQKANKLLFSDTNHLETLVYANAYYKDFDKEPESKILEASVLGNNYDLYLLTDVDIPWEPDPLRDKPNERKKMFDLFETALKKYKFPYIVVSGSMKKRIEVATKAINRCLDSI